MKFYSCIKNNEMRFTGKWIKVEIIIFHGVTHTQKYKDFMFPLTSGLIFSLQIYVITEKKNKKIHAKLL